MSGVRPGSAGVGGSPGEKAGKNQTGGAEWVLRLPGPVPRFRPPGARCELPAAVVSPCRDHHHPLPSIPKPRCRVRQVVPRACLDVLRDCARIVPADFGGVGGVARCVLRETLCAGAVVSLAGAIWVPFSRPWALAQPAPPRDVMLSCPPARRLRCTAPQAVKDLEATVKAKPRECPRSVRAKARHLAGLDAAVRSKERTLSQCVRKTSPGRF